MGKWDRFPRVKIMQWPRRVKCTVGISPSQSSASNRSTAPTPPLPHLRLGRVKDGPWLVLKLGIILDAPLPPLPPNPLPYPHITTHPSRVNDVTLSAHG